MIAVLSVAPFDDQLRSGASRELATHVVTAIYIPLLWYVVGKRLDGRGKRKSVTLSKAEKAATVAGLAALLIVAIVMTWGLLEGQRYTMVGMSLAWVGWGILALWFRLREAGSEFQTH